MAWRKTILWEWLVLVSFDPKRAGHKCRSSSDANVTVSPLLTAAGAIIPIIIIIVVVVGVIILVSSLAKGFTSSGRGLDTDEWEVDHSVWMNQLQKDFEDSWSTQ